jgi:hypothetical protein
MLKINMSSFGNITKLDNSSKLSFYSTFKSEYKLEDYLTTIRNASQRKAVTKFRISCHKL